MNDINFTKSSIRYVFKNLWYIILLAIFPGACLGGMACMNGAYNYTYEFYYNFFTGRLRDISWLQIFGAFSIYNFTDGLSALFSLFSFLVIVLCASLLLALIDKHMRIGKRTLNGVLEKLNDNVLSTCFVTLLFSALYELWTVLFSSLAYGVFAIPNLAVQYILFIVLLIAGFGVLLYTVALFYLWLPCMQITGFKAFEALRYSNQMTEQVKRKLILSMLVSVVVLNILIVPTVIFLHEFSGLVFLISSIAYTLCFMLFVVRMEAAYFDAAQIEREDLKKNYR